MENWSPDRESLSSFVWDYDFSDPERLRMFQLGVEIGSVSQVLRVSIDMRIPSLTAFARPREISEQQIIAHLRADLEEASGKIRELIGENERLKEELQHSHLSSAEIHMQLEEVTKSIALQIQSLSDENAALRLSLSEESQGVRGVANEQSLQLLNESNLRRDAAVLMDMGVAEKVGSRYKQSAQLLQQAWNLAKPAGDKQTAAVGAALGEVLGVHLGKGAEALQVLSTSLEIERLFDPTSEEVMKVNNLIAEVCFLQGEYRETETICWETLRAISDNSDSSEHFWTAGIYLTYTLCELNRFQEAEVFVADWMKMSFQTTSRLTDILKFCVRGRLRFARRANAEAENLLANAYKLAARDFPTAIYAALIEFWLGRLSSVTKQPVKAKEQLCKAETIFAYHFPNSIWAAYNLIWLATACNNMIELTSK